MNTNVSINIHTVVGMATKHITVRKPRHIHIHEGLVMTLPMQERVNANADQRSLNINLYQFAASTSVFSS